MNIDDAVTIRADAVFPLGRIDQYELVRELGGGGFGTVYLAKDTVSGIEVAVKGLPPFVKNSKEELENIRRNFALVSRLTHENIAKALVLHPAKVVSYADKRTEANLKVQEGDTLMVMDFAPGMTLSSWRKQFPGGKVPVDQTAEIVRQIASALDYAHAQRVIHRDIKPSNIMIDTRPDGAISVKVLDFGLAAEMRSSMSRVSMMITDISGTRPYMAPEQWQGRRQAEATDQYALAVLAYELLTGDVPFASAFASGDPMVMMNVVVHEPADIPCELPRSLKGALSVALAKKMEDRFGSCMQFAEGCKGKFKASSKVLAHVSKVLCILLAVLCAGGAGWWCWQDLESKARERREAEYVRLQNLKNAAIELKVRAEQAKADAEKRGFGGISELSRLFREFNRQYKTGQVFFSSANYVAATNAFYNVGTCMRELVKEKKRLDEEAARLAEERRLREEKERHEAELTRLVGLGYVRVGDKVEWRSGVPHRSDPKLETDVTPETWRSAKAGWVWDGGASAVWRPGIEHPDRRNWLSSEEPDRWVPKKGYLSQGESRDGLPELSWTPGLRHGGCRASQREGVWERQMDCDMCSGRGTVERRSSCRDCGGSASVSYEMTCTACSGSGSRSVRERCASCTGGYSVGECTSGCSQITRNGMVIFNRGFVCSDCNGSGQKANVAGAIAAGFAGAFSGRRGYRPPPPPALVPCMRCSGLGGYVCSNCSGSGQIRSACSICGGSGGVSGTRSCRVCDGSGKVTRTRTCGSCRNGSVSAPTPCTRCDGAGKIWTEQYGEPCASDRHVPDEAKEIRAAASRHAVYSQDGTKRALYAFGAGNWSAGYVNAKSADMGNPEIHNWLGKCYDPHVSTPGLRIPKDLAKSTYHYKRAQELLEKERN